MLSKTNNKLYFSSSYVSVRIIEVNSTKIITHSKYYISNKIIVYLFTVKNGFCPYFLKYLILCFCFETIKYCVLVSKLDLKKKKSNYK